MAPKLHPLVVDLDGTLVAVDTLHELVVQFTKNHFWKLPALLGAVVKGPAHFKDYVSHHVELDYSTVPVNTDVIELIREAQTEKRPVVLATAAHHTVANKVALAVGGFDEVIGSTAETNMKGQRKADELVSRFGHKGFDYVGDSFADFPVFDHASRSYLVPSRRTVREATTSRDNMTVLGEPPKVWSALVRLLRPHQWAKNLLLFVPVVASQQLSLASVWPLLVAFIAFSAVSSAVYVLNDLLDAQEDRRHPEKKKRPIAAGVVSLPAAVWAIVGLVAVGGGLSLTLLSPAFFVVLVVYSVVTTAYSTWWKQIVLLDVFVLTALYGIRLVGGAIVASVPLSPWLIAFSFFAFLSLALGKRYVEMTADHFSGVNNGRAYRVADIPVVLGLGIGSGLISSLVLALYVDSDSVVELYSRPTLILAIVPLWTLWISRVWLLAHRNTLHSDPVLFALRDRTSYLVAVAALVVLFLGR